MGTSVLFLDVNVCLYAFRPTISDRSAAVARWLEDRLNGPERVLVSESVLASMIRIATHPGSSRSRRARPPRWPSRFPSLRTIDPLED